MIPGQDVRDDIRFAHGPQRPAITGRHTLVDEGVDGAHRLTTPFRHEGSAGKWRCILYTAEITAVAHQAAIGVENFAMGRLS
jgi:hypothetical protein